ncbi:sugar kinase [Aquimarina sp. ERC-38]|uniref:sugar kinase n=1 Tax=Aquimarina sp. ERC-38 TaxID=2949996 RepID=UPI002247AACE|nr:sugar kinase [Aquimarina sp. ERC-38]UZO81574.1 sugar kinase [Aquimarina sp. ERC-38]
MNKRIITLGEVLMRLTTPVSERFLQAQNYNIYFGGAEANVSVALANWGVSTAHVTSFPAHDIGRAATNYLKQHGVDTSFVYTNEGRMGLYFLENGVMQRSSKIIYDRFDSSFSKLDPATIDWDLVFKDADWFHWTGITPAASATAAQICLDALKAAEKKGITVSGDINYRRNLWQYGKQPLDIMPELVSRTHVIIAGLTDFENCMDIISDDFTDACQKAIQAFPSIETIANTHRESVSASHNRLTGMLYKNGKLLTSKTYDISHIVDRIGGGDSFMSGLIYGLMNKNDQDALEFAVAASVLKHSIIGDANLTSIEEVEQLTHGVNIGKLLR